MKNFKTIVIALTSIFLFQNAFCNTKTYPFKVQKTGQGAQALIFIPGFACPGEVWDETKSKFEEEYTCYTLTMAGFAGVASQPNATFKNWEVAIVSYIKEHQLKKPILIGHSMGGGLAMAIAADYPKLIDKIVPDLLVKGSDYKAEEIFGDKVILNGGKIILVDLLPGVSTSILIEENSL